MNFSSFLLVVVLLQFLIHAALVLSEGECPHKQVIQAGKLWDIACYDKVMATANNDGIVRLWSLESG